jgi:effector-binding domain-containing protein
MSNTTLEIIQGLSQAASNAYDGSHDERFVVDGQDKKVGLKREDGCPIMDKRVADGFKVRFYGDSMILSYQAEVMLKEVYGGTFETDIHSMLNEIKKWLEKEYRAVTGNSVKLTSKGDPNILVQSTSRVRNWVEANQHFKIGGIEAMPILEPSIDSTRDVTRKFLEQFTDKRPSNDTRKKSDNQKKA